VDAGEVPEGAVREHVHQVAAASTGPAGA
jgi:hypothetical protein